MDFYEWKFQTLYPRVQAHLLDLGYGVHQAQNRHHALETVLDLLPRDQSIGMCASRTLTEIGLVDALREKGYPLLDRFRAADEHAHAALCRQALTADTYVSGVNAITRDGRLLFSDDTGDRAAAVLFGPRQVILVAGMNKIMPDVDLAIKRIHCGPAEAPQDGDAPTSPGPGTDGLRTPSPRPGHSLTIIENCRRTPRRIQVVLVMEQLGA